MLPYEAHETATIPLFFRSFFLSCWDLWMTRWKRWDLLKQRQKCMRKFRHFFQACRISFKLTRVHMSTATGAAAQATTDSRLSIPARRTIEAMNISRAASLHS